MATGVAFISDAALVTKCLSWPLGQHDSAFLVDFTDLHEGGPTDRRAAFAHRRFVETHDNAYWVQGGDGGEYSTPASVQLPQDDKYNPTAQKIRQTKFFRSIKDKCLGWLDGNHSARMRKATGENVDAEICDALGILDRYAGAVECDKDGDFLRAHPAQALWLELLLGKGNHGRAQRYAGYVCHGSGGASNPGNRLNAAWKRAYSKGGIDFVLMGHHHQFNAGVIEREDWEPHVKEKVQRPVLLVTAGGLCRKTEFQEERALPFGPPRGNILWFSGQQHWVSVWDFPLSCPEESISLV